VIRNSRIPDQIEGWLRAETVNFKLSASKYSPSIPVNYTDNCPNECLAGTKSEQTKTSKLEELKLF